MSIRRFFRLPPSEGTVARDIDEEIAFHIETRYAELVSAGVPALDARRRAEQEFGDVASARDELASIDRVTLRRERRAAWGDAFLHDARIALRGMRRNPAFTLAVVLTLALGIGVNAAMFGITDRLLLSPPAHVADADGVVRVLYGATSASGEYTYVSHLPYPDYTLMRESGAFADVGAYTSAGRSVLGRGEAATEVRVAQATSTFFPLLGVQPAIGRFFSAEEDALPRGVPVVVLSHELWQERYGGAADVLGSTLEIDHERYEIIGVAPRGFSGVNLDAVHAWVPVSARGTSMGGDGWYATRSIHYLQLVARLHADMDSAVARQRASALFLADYGNRFADDSTAGIVLGSIIAARAPMVGAGHAQRSGRIALWLFGVSLLVVLIACVNVINLLLARSMRQRRETGVRMALGISRRRLLAQTMTETLLISLLGAASGLVLAHWGGEVARATLLPDVEWTGSTVSRRVILFSVAIALACALLATVAPTLHSMRSHVTALVGLAGRITYRRSRLRSGLVAVQAALSVLLLVGSGLFLRSLGEAGEIPLGYEPDGVAAFSWHSRGLEWDRERTLALYDRSLERVQSMPQVEAAALSMTQPLWSSLYGYLRVPGIDSIPTSQDILYSPVSAGYFETMGARVLQGRAFGSGDVAGAPPVVMITQSLARVIWPDGSALGRCIVTDPADDSPCREVVGVVEDTRYSSVFDAPALMFYLPMAQVPGRGTMRGLLVRLRGDSEAGIAAVRTALHSLEPGLPYVQADILAERVAPYLQPWRLGAVMFTAFGVLALALASLGIYGVVAYDVAQRRREMGVRVALGARASMVLRMVLSDAVRVVGLGLLLGIMLSLAAGRAIQPLLFEVSARDPVVHGAVGIVLLTIALFAAAVPAWRAARVQPTEALRDD